jgi:hypothetical protein
MAGMAIFAVGIAALLLVFGVTRGSEGEATPLPVIAVGGIVSAAGSDTAGMADAVGTMLATNLARLPELQIVSSLRMYELLAQLAGSGTMAGRRPPGPPRRVR